MCVRVEESVVCACVRGEVYMHVCKSGRECMCEGEVYMHVCESGRECSLCMCEGGKRV